MPFHSILWHDPNVNNDENKRIQQEFRRTAFDVQVATQFEDARDRLGQKLPTEKWLVITSGTDGRKLVSAIHAFRCVAEIIIFCGTKQYHSGWSKNYSKVSRVVDLVEDLVAAVDEIDACMTLGTILGGISNPVGVLLAGGMNPALVSYADATWCCAKFAQAKAFMVIIARMRRTQITEDMVLSDVRKLVRYSELRNFNVQWAGPWRRADGLEHVTGASVAQKMCLGYTSDFFYGPLNQKLANVGQLGCVLNCVDGLVMPVLEQQALLGHRGGCDLYRGFPPTHVKARDYLEGHDFFWPPFASVSDDINIA
eukprot:TRINITY_DN43651_c0_g1_i1.p1 TRINITY_DN43651_c0_g1~~TRINITY_DN43651_c0_g1_i1.p1  ORF type:complete len:311 (-),score=50.31 TRINITY_DN43651_c0_g1_i1:856-1788(-)